MKDKGKRYLAEGMDAARHKRVVKRLARKRKKKERQQRVPHWVYRIILILAISVAGMLLWFNRENLAPANVVEWMQDRIVGMGEGDGYPHRFDSDIRAGNFTSVNKEAVMVSDTSLVILNGSAKELINRQHSFSTPVMKAGGARTLIYNLGGTGYQVEGYSKTLIKGATNQNILGGGIAGNGCFALLTQAKGYCGKLTAYKADGKAKYYYYFSEFYPTSVALNAEGTKALVTAISAREGGLISAIYLLDFNSEKAVEPLQIYQDNMMLDCWYDSGGTAVAIGDQLLTVVRAGGDRADYSYGGMQLTAWASGGGRTALSLASYENAASSQIVFLDAAAKQTASAVVPGLARTISVYGESAAVLSDGEISVFSMQDGSRVGSAPAGSDAKAAALASESRAYVLGVSEVRMVEIE